MKASLEVTSIRHRGVILTSETDEERKILRDIWIGKGRPASYANLEDGNIEIAIAPTAEPEGEDQ